MGAEVVNPPGCERSATWGQAKKTCSQVARVAVLVTQPLTTFFGQQSRGSPSWPFLRLWNWLRQERDQFHHWRNVSYDWKRLLLFFSPLCIFQFRFAKEKKFYAICLRLVSFQYIRLSQYRGYRILWLSACDTFVCMFHQFPTLCFELEQVWDHIYNIIVY